MIRFQGSEPASSHLRGNSIALADQDAEIEPVPTGGGGFIPEPELDRLSNILRTFNEHYKVKRYKSEKISSGDSWSHSRITLKPLNPAFDPIVLTEEVEGQVTVIAECVEVLGSGY